ncbi:MAG: hypothetical protein OXC07_08585 [Kistimonas sp.]|nr:hypothetical protein [Kistimonas sp.]
MKKNTIAVFSWLVTAWITKVFLFSLPYKFTGHPDTRHIFETIGLWMGGVLGEGFGQWFATWGASVVGSAELLVSVLLLSPVILSLVGRFVRLPVCCNRACLHSLGGFAAVSIMTGAVFFHLFTPLGIKVLHEGKSDGGSLFYAACSIWVLGLAMALINLPLCSGCKKQNRGN